MDLPLGVPLASTCKGGLLVDLRQINPDKKPVSIA